MFRSRQCLLKEPLPLHCFAPEFATQVVHLCGVVEIVEKPIIG